VLRTERYVLLSEGQVLHRLLAVHQSMLSNLRGRAATGCPVTRITISADVA
jgi:hypothetical protein